MAFFCIVIRYLTAVIFFWMDLCVHLCFDSVCRSNIPLHTIENSWTHRDCLSPIAPENGNLFFAYALHIHTQMDIKCVVIYIGCEKPTKLAHWIACVRELAQRLITLQL